MSRSKLDDLGFLELAPGIDPVDIVAVHGLDGHREETWTTEDGILWLCDLLPSDLPNARILMYEYDADTRYPRRPIIFIAHNLGGILVKWTPVICHNQSLASQGNLRDILVSTHGVLFFGTPHSGMEATLVETVNRLASLYMKTTDTILKDIRAHSSDLATVQSLYVEASERISSVFFCEEYATPMEGKRRTLNVPHHSAGASGFTSLNPFIDGGYRHGRVPESLC
ncbi:related to LipA and NB-ARC domain protein-Aspergillus clavatus [Serendipita indica DSM 11827]|uniref:Related to LipA and NB-ARC domain protein-Aspergillus clavatus n=1 Tax=Serendipita indica (strain DSM 11827) TaxID=1109443 RepID=G4TZJ6_SERID|nr:related to LipA and NB-ARC domain protein-Aspergillus clavatus [Serendipita indica DSM 11827]